jgi:hypothetical protein
MELRILSGYQVNRGKPTIYILQNSLSVKYRFDPDNSMNKKARI